MQTKILKVLTSAMVVAAMVLTLVAVSTASADAASKNTYKIRVNKKANVATVYQKRSGKWKPIRAMRCSCGTAATPSPSGTWTLKAKWRWIMMNTNGAISYEQYVIRFYQQYYTHSVSYVTKNKNKQYTDAFNKLGTNQSHGCIRFATMDAKWIYDNCPSGTKITIYSSSNPGPLGKPARINNPSRSAASWDPTDPDKNNPNFRMRKPVFKISKKTSVKCGAKYSLKSGVKVRNTNANQDVSSLLKVKKLTRNGKTISVKSFTTKAPGKYSVWYYVRDKYETQNGKKGVTKKFTFKVKDKTDISGAKDKNVALNSVNAVSGVKAKALSGDRTSAIKVTVTAPDKAKKTLSYDAAKSYKFSQFGTYTLTYTVTNRYPKTEVKETVKITTLKKVPSYVGKTYDEAKKAAEKAGFTVAKAKSQTAAAEPAQANTVAKQNPVAGKSLKKGGKITLTLYKYTAPQDAEKSGETESASPKSGDAAAEK